MVWSDAVHHDEKPVAVGNSTAGRAGGISSHLADQREQGQKQTCYVVVRGGSPTQQSTLSIQVPPSP